jgi:hypothetical protein
MIQDIRAARLHAAAESMVDAAGRRLLHDLADLREADERWHAARDEAERARLARELEMRVARVMAEIAEEDRYDDEEG